MGPAGDRESLSTIPARKISHCPCCGFDKVDLEPLVSKNPEGGKRADFYCRNCESSGIIDVDNKFARALAELDRIPRLVKKALEDAGYVVKKN